MNFSTVTALLFAVFITVSTGIPTAAQPDITQVTVSASQLRKHVFLLASDSLQGRATGTKSQLQVAIYCTQTFRQSHLVAPFRLDSIRGSFRQTFAFTITEVALFGGMHTYGSNSPTYKKHELVPLPLTAKDSSQVLFGDNVAGLLIGTDLRQEILVMSAHYDHLGNTGGRVYHGADDNASGTATILSIIAARLLYEYSNHSQQRVLRLIVSQ